MMANDNPNMTGLRSFNRMSRSESTEIQSRGGKASASKRRELKRIADIVQLVRKESDVDPVVACVQGLFAKLTDNDLKIKDTLQLLSFIKAIEPEYKPEKKQSSIGEMLAFRNYIEAIGDPDIAQDEKDRRTAELQKYTNVDL